MLVGNNCAPVKASSVNYTQITSQVRGVERGKSSDGNEEARNWLDGIYASTKTAIKYPTFQPVTYSMNYINHNDAFNIAKAMTEEGNIYGFTKAVDSHLLKDSEWGAVTYLSQSVYGVNQSDIMVNNINLNSGEKERTNVTGRSGVDSVYAVTGCTSGSKNTGEMVKTIDDINGTTGNTANNGVYTWDQLTGCKASSTGNMYGVYDLSGGIYEKTSSYIINQNQNLKINGSSMCYDKDRLRMVSTKYTMAYLVDSRVDNVGITGEIENLNTASEENWKKNQLIYGNAIQETSNGKTGPNAWREDSAYYPSLNFPFLVRGGFLWNGPNAGLFYYYRNNGDSLYNNGFRVVLIP